MRGQASKNLCLGRKQWLGGDKKLQTQRRRKQIPIVPSLIDIHRVVAFKDVVEEVLVVVTPPITTVFTKHRFLIKTSPRIAD